MSSNNNADIKVLAIMTGGTLFMERNKDNLFKLSSEKKISLILDQMTSLQYFKKETSKPIYTLEFMENCTPKRIQMEIIEMSELKDSSNMSFEDWNLICEKLESNHDKYNGFVIIIGTDTMTQAASALSFMCENLDRSIVLTGAQIPIFEARNDSWNNLISSVIVAGTSNLHEVMICFHNKLYRGNRCVKVDSRNFEAYESPNFEPLAILGVDIKYKMRESSLTREGTFQVFQMEEKNIVRLVLQGPSDVDIIKSYFDAHIQGVVVYAYGSGNGPIKVAESLRDLANKKLVVVVSQCLHTIVEEAYVTGLVQGNVVSGSDMTPDTAFLKMCYLLNKFPGNVDLQRQEMRKSIRGEMSG
ncbi:L-asparaginase [Biomphalaria pfeifferi]|uniref:asparaginase n=1 Tax=Biomphalaria pfeifferi TaxID=112525 RepID=A0AAD8AZC1_BIOPF|nr:L-asparaginase [Biomphalaria pfeifferi]